ncbi:MAG TPA: hypothetical protein VIV11_11210 [Kofleriaceae bacterium]
MNRCGDGISRHVASHLQHLWTMLARTAIAAWLLFACEKQPAQPPPPDPTAECVRDEDCTLMPSELTCCAECPPAPPFEAAPAWVVDGLYIEVEHRCLDTAQPCPEIRCAPLPSTCSARAACVRGTCTVVATGCDRRRPVV